MPNLLRRRRLCPIQKKKLNRCTILRSLYGREINGTRMNVFRATSQTVHPNCSILDVKTPTPFLRKFSPDGRHFIAFSSNLTSVEVYDYCGCSKAADLLKNFEKDIIGADDTDYLIRDQIFDVLFNLKCRIKVTVDNEKLSRTCMLFTENGDYAVVASSVVKEDSVELSETYSNNESVSPTRASPLENYTIYLVDLKHGLVRHSILFNSDKIILNYNQGIYLFNNTLAVLSVQHQTIYIYKIFDNHLHLIRKIGQYCHEDDHNLIASVYPFMKSSSYKPYRERSINGLKHKFMVSLYKKAVHEGEKSKSYVPLRTFYEKFKQLLTFRIWKMQLLDENHLLVRYAAETVVAMKVPSPNVEESYFMVYDMTTNTVLDTYENSSDEFLKVYENYIDNFRLSFTNPEGLIPCSIANNKYLWESYKNAKEMMIRQYDGTKELNKLVLGLLPLAAQSFTSSPYLDTSLYTYNEKWISPIEIPRETSNHAIGFYSRKSGSPCFYLHTGRPRYSGLNRMVDFAFHPTEPFAISIVKEQAHFIINFHIHKVKKPVRKSRE